MLIPKKNRKLVYERLFEDGVMVAKQDTKAPKHHTIDVPNLEVLVLMKSLTSRGYVKENFNWGWHYWFLKNEGIVYLREYLHLPEEVVPATLKKPKQPVGRPTGSQPRGPRRAFGEGDKKAAPGAEFKPEFKGFGRGGPRREGPGREGYRRDPGKPGNI